MEGLWGIAGAPSLSLSHHVQQTQITNNLELFPQSKQQQLRAASTTTLRPPRPRLDGPIMGPMVMAARLITTVDAGTAGVPYAS